MTKNLDDALAVLRCLPESMQATAAQAIIDYASSYEEQQASA